MDPIIILNNASYTHDKYEKYWELLCESVEPYSKVIKGNEIDEFLENPIETVNGMTVLVFDDFDASKSRNWFPIINKLTTSSLRAAGRNCAFIIADKHVLNKTYFRDKRIVIKKEW